MRCTEFASRVAAWGFILVQIGSLPVLADTSHDTPDLRQRVFFSREAEPWPGEVATIVSVAEGKDSAGDGRRDHAGRTRTWSGGSAGVACPGKRRPTVGYGIAAVGHIAAAPWAAVPAVPRP